MRSHVDFGQHGNQTCPGRYSTDYGDIALLKCKLGDDTRVPEGCEQVISPAYRVAAAFAIIGSSGTLGDAGLPSGQTAKGS